MHHVAHELEDRAVVSAAVGTGASQLRDQPRIASCSCTLLSMTWLPAARIAG